MEKDDSSRLPTIFNCVNDGIFVHDIDTGAIIDVNSAACALYGYTREEMLGSTVGTMSEGVRHFSQDDAMAWLRAAASGEPQLFEWHARRKNGELFWIEVNMRRATVDGRDRIVVVTRDITERRGTMEKLRASEAFLDSIIEHSPYSTWVSDEKGTMIRMNQVLRDTLHVADADLVGRYNIFEDAQVIAQGHMPAVHRVFEQGETVRFTMRYDSSPLQDCAERHPTDLILDITISPVLDEAGRTIHAIIQHYDVTEMTRAADTIRRLNEELEHRVEARTAELRDALKELESFNYSVSHDLRTPLRAIDGFTRILMENLGPRLDAESARLGSLVRQNARRMGELIDDLLAFSRVGRVDMRSITVDMTALADDAVQACLPPGDRERVDLRVDPLPPAMGDPILLRQVLTNLMANAVKFSSKRERAVIRVYGETAGAEAVYHVRDNGTGFDMRYADKLFKVFQRLHTDQEFEGTGVGLAIVQRIIHKHGGRVWAEGQLDEGATFSFALPRPPAPTG